MWGDGRRVRSAKRFGSEAHAAIDAAGVHVNAADLSDGLSRRVPPRRAAADVDVILTRLGAPVSVVRVVVGASVDQLHDDGLPRPAQLVVGDPVALKRVLPLEVAGHFHTLSAVALL